MAPLRQLSEQEQQKLTQICRRRVTQPIEAFRAKIFLAVARGADYDTAARQVGRCSSDAVSHLIARSNAGGSAVATTRRRLGSR